MKEDILDEIIFNAGSKDNLIMLRQDDESLQEYEDRIYSTALDLFMGAVEDLGLECLDDEDVAPYDDIREETLLDICKLLMVRRIDVTCGYREEYPNGDIYYYGGETDNGVCYKDLDAWESGEGVCYLCEGDFLEQDNDDNIWVYTLHNGDELFNTREDIIADMAEYLPNCDVKFIEQCAENVLQTCDWQCLTTLMEEIDWEEVVREAYKEGTEVYWLDPAGETSQVYEIYSEVGPEMVKLSNDYSECEALLCEVYRKSDKLCPHCGGPLYHEKYDNTMDHYPYFCPECDENFFEIETR